MPRIIQKHVLRNNAPAPTSEDYYRIKSATDFLNHALSQLDSRFKEHVFVCNKGFSVIPSILLATTGLPAELLLGERMWKGKNDIRKDIPDGIDATLEKTDKGP